MFHNPAVMDASASARTSARASFLTWSAAALFTALIALHTLGVLGSEVFTIVAVSAVGACVYSAVRGLMRPRLAILLLLAALVFFAVGGSARLALGTLGDLSNTRSLLPDLLTLPGYFLIAAFFLALVRARSPQRNVDALLDSLVASFAVFSCVWAFLLVPALEQGSSSFVIKSIIALYPALSVVLVVLPLRLAFDRTATRNVAAQLYLIAFVFLFTGDILYTLAELQLATLPLQILDLPYLIAYTAAMFAVLHPAARDLGTPGTASVGVSKWRLFTVSTGLLIPTLVLVFRPPAQSGDRFVLVAAIAALTLAVAARVYRALLEQVHARRALSDQALTDSLTDLPNRAAIDDLLGRLSSERSATALVFLDLDRFKFVNDTYGHAAGDQLLVAVGQRLRSAVREDDTVARFGGDEFVVVLPDTSQADALEVADRVRSLLTESFEMPFGPVSSSVSIGVVHSQSCGSAIEMLRQADTALYEAKDRGRNRVVFYDGDLAERTSKRLSLEHDLHGALDRAEFTLLYQPVVRPDSGKVIGFEALLRWNHPTLKPWEVSPDKFIPVAEESGAIIPVGAWVLNEACRQLSIWRELPGQENLTMAVNVSARQVVDPGFVALVTETLVRHSLPATALDLEITESIFLQGADVGEIFRTLRDLGVTLSIDDFGQGYSSLSYLRRFPVDHLKIDREYVNTMCVSEKDRALVGAVLAMAKAMGLKTIAEGVENVAQAAALSALGCDYAQGYLYDRPLPAAEALTRLAAPVTGTSTLKAVADRTA